MDLAFIVGNWTDIDRSFPSGFHGNADASHKNAGVKDMESVRLLIRDLCPFGVDLPEIPTLFVDCEPVIAVANGASTRSCTKHIDFKVWLCRDYVGRKVVQLTYVPTAMQIADFFTKQLGPGPYVVYRARFMSFLPTLIA